MSKPTIVLVPGSFGLPEFYNQVLDPISAAGYDIEGLHLPSVGESALKGRDGVPPTMYDDAAFIAEKVQRLADEDKSIILVAHSYGGVPVTQSTKGLSRKERESSGKKGGIVSVAYMTCLTPALGKSAAEILAGVPEGQKVNMPIDVSSHRSRLLICHLSGTFCSCTHGGTSANLLAGEWMGIPTGPCSDRSDHCTEHSFI